ncbi:Aspartyl-tRNA(Asn) amidotransferase subunit C [Mycoplasmopsis meleagridis]|uniref:Aspartyl-tRNA(Asn) amidotransferase subunit C, Glutamyl-tRNA(Gln) amidotransferase subunit C n=1 Tax=Mycoplasmopsis meleagridis ATCC 25294 TaxID=1264554 RepID=A0A0F5H028_9BACT|nr:Asp-tRNA(Asn)/Glu-tRNA(Gln) amidotransferase subunit GatC [Mycoplasmopsis meleagridis]KKB26671.1 Aspartyl-tRNA(Asn) amidotransferase subunit C, Glutamyl-tRNA(Gln) amidotransferase subunit C [Mycoplasmopsis meleagridis ATCC 25294]KUH47627.1 glutamyl-tRNA amidotransferase [Mycoplasmopsis meleagridis]OAD18214.1 Aspartyl-tRNA(Asn) amidotransferase subunit C [Mycoplasmopsis meleagridis]VEU77726.1 glutamyl-tRNA amidotransferase subunit C [Mycoplasmopsis meleagridis]
MKEINKDKLKNIVSSIMLNPTNEVIENILQEWNILHENLAILDQLDLKNVEPLTHIDENKYIDFLREDKVDTSFSISKKDALKNAKEKDEDFIITVKVVN